MPIEHNRDPDLEWIDHVPPVGLLVAPSLLKELGLPPQRQTPIDTGIVAELIGTDATKPALADPWPFVERVLGWEARNVAGAPGGPVLPDDLLVLLPEHGTTLRPTWAVAELGDPDRPWQLLVRIEAPGVNPDARNALDGWEATPQQRFERLLRDTGVFAGLLISEREERRDGEIRYEPEFRLVYSPRGETSGHQSFPIRPMGIVAGRPMLGGLKLLLDRFRLFSDSDDRRLPALLNRSRDAQALVSTALAEQVLGALHELLRGLDSAEPALIRELAANRPDHLYEGLLTVLMRLVFVLYAEDRDLLPSRSEARAREIYNTSYSVRGLYARLTEDVALNPDTMDERRGGWGGLLALFRLIHKGHKTGFVQARGGKLFDPDEFPFLEGRTVTGDPAQILKVSDGCLLRILEGLMTLKLRGAERERLSYRTLDVEQIGSVYETVMGFTVEAARCRVLAIKAGKNNKTPVFVALDELLAKTGKDRVKHLKESAGRALTASQARPVEEARTVEALAAAFEGIVDARGSPQGMTPAGSPILQPTDERRRTGSHYTPRSLTAPIVKYALEPTFERLGVDATPEQILDLKVCDPAMGSGAFLVEACRVIGERLGTAWARWSDKRPTIPPDEDEELHARRLVAQRCLYGVDKNPRAVDLARLSLWLATLARDHEFTFLDHALKCGDSLVGLTEDQISATHWDTTKPPTFVGKLVSDHLKEAERGRARIREQAEWASESELRPQFKAVETRLEVARLIGDGIVAAFFSADKLKKRIEHLVAFQKLVQTNLGSREWDEKAARFSDDLLFGEHPIPPFHWQIEFPEVFSRGNPGFDAIVGNPPFAGKNTIIGGNSGNYLPWLQTLHAGAHGNADLVAHFFRRAFGLLRQGGVFGLIATNTIGQGDTRASGLTTIIADGGAIMRATRRLKWPGEAAVVVSVVHIVKGAAAAPVLDKRQVRRISAYLVEGDLDTSPLALAANDNQAFAGIEIGSPGFLFANKDAGSPLELGLSFLAVEHFATVIKPYLGTDEVNKHPSHLHHRLTMDFRDLPLKRSDVVGWKEAAMQQRTDWLDSGIVPADYESPVVADWPELFTIITENVEHQRGDYSSSKWWQFERPRPEMSAAISGLLYVLCVSRSASPHLAIARVRTGQVLAKTLAVFAFSNFAPFAALQSRAHEIWARFFSSSMKDDLRYAPSDCFRTFPFPVGFETDAAFEAAGETYHAFRAQLMIDRNEGLTKTYNRFHARGENAADIAHLRALHAEMDTAILRAYGWDDLADRAAPEFIEQDADEGKTPKTRLDWSAEFKDEVLARLLALNTERAAAERAAGLVVAPDDEDEEEDEDA
jgi:hypothetical protein